MLYVVIVFLMTLIPPNMPVNSSYFSVCLYFILDPSSPESWYVILGQYFAPNGKVLRTILCLKIIPLLIILVPANTISNILLCLHSCIL